MGIPIILHKKELQTTSSELHSLTDLLRYFLPLTLNLDSTEDDSLLVFIVTAAVLVFMSETLVCSLILHQRRFTREISSHLPTFTSSMNEGRVRDLAC